MLLGRQTFNKQTQLSVFGKKAMGVSKKTQVFKNQVEEEGGLQPEKQFEYHLINAVSASGQSTIKIQKREDLLLSEGLGRASERS